MSSHFFYHTEKVKIHVKFQTLIKWCSSSISISPDRSLSYTMKQNFSMSVTQKQQNVHTACTNSLPRVQGVKKKEEMSEVRQTCTAVHCACCVCRVFDKPNNDSLFRSEYRRRIISRSFAYRATFLSGEGNMQHKFPHVPSHSKSCPYLRCFAIRPQLPVGVF